MGEGETVQTSEWMKSPKERIIKIQVIYFIKFLSKTFYLLEKNPKLPEKLQTVQRTFSSFFFF